MCNSPFWRSGCTPFWNAIQWRWQELELSETKTIAAGTRYGFLPPGTPPTPTVALNTVGLSITKACDGGAGGSLGALWFRPATTRWRCRPASASCSGATARSGRSASLSQKWSRWSTSRPSKTTSGPWAWREGRRWGGQSLEGTPRIFLAYFYANARVMTQSGEPWRNRAGNHSLNNRFFASRWGGYLW